MKISDIFNKQPLSSTDRSDSAAQTRKSGRDDLQQGISSQYGEDTVTISPMSRQLAQMARIMADDEIKSQEKIAALKEEIEKGSYNISSDEIAQAFLSYIKDKQE